MRYQRRVGSVRFDSDIKGLLKGVEIGCSILCAVEMMAGIVIYAAGFFHLKADPVSIIGVILGAVVANLVKWGIPSINGMVIAAACYLIGTKRR